MALREDVERDGFAILKDVLARVEIGELLTQLESSSLQWGRAGARNALSAPKIAAAVARSPLLEVASTILGGNALAFRATFFDKSPASNWLVAWHQDRALPGQPD